MNSLRRFAMIMALACGAASSVAYAQNRPPLDTLSARAVAESLKVLARLEQGTAARPNDTASWFHRGLLAGTLAQRRAQANPPPGLDLTKLRIEAADALNRALELDARDPKHWLALAGFEATGDQVRDPLAHASATELLKRIHTLFSASADSATQVKILLALADDQWFFYNKFESFAVDAFSSMDHDYGAGMQVEARTQRETMSSMTLGKGSAENAGRQAKAEPIKAFGTNDPPGSHNPHSVSAAAGRDTLSTLPRVLARAANQVIEAYGLPGDFDSRGEARYLWAQKYYEEAYAVAPNDLHAFRGLARLHAARDHWPQLLGLAEDHVRRVPSDPWGWMALGLVDQRLKASDKAVAAFDSGFARMTPALRAYLERLDRVLRPSDSLAFARSDSATRLKEAQLSWLIARPLWSLKEEQPNIEFLARIAYAELRFGTSGNVIGSDTPKGQLYVRYGPPDMKQDAFWLYNSGLIFAFEDSDPRKERPDRPLNVRVREWQPARWDNIAETQIDSMPIQVARFRAGADSVDVFVAAQAQMRAFDTVRTINTVGYTNYWLSGLTTPSAFKDSLPLSASGTFLSTRRVPAGRYYYRIESIIPGALVAGRAAALMTMGADTVTGFAMRGFGMSDVIAATHANASETAHRWSDLTVSPVLGSTPRGGELSLIWETYEAGRTGGVANYNVTIRLLRDAPTVAFGDKIGARIVRGITGAAGVSRKEAGNGVTFQFARDVPYSPTLVDNVTLSLEGTPPGDYIVRIEVTDRVTGRTTSRTTGIVIHE